MDASFLKPLAAEQLPPKVAAVLAGPTPAKLMAVRGMAPLRPAELLLVIYQLAFDADPSVKAQSEAAPASLPDKILLGPLADRIPSEVLHFFADRLPISRSEAIEKILYNQGTDDGTFVLLAKRLGENALEIIFQNEQRLLRSPAIVEALYFNQHARMSSVRRALELCVRNQVRLEGIPAFEEVAADLLSHPSGIAPVVPDQEFRAVLTEELPAVPDEAAPETKPSSNTPERKNKPSTSFIKFDELEIFEKIRLATVGNAYCRQMLIRDTNKLVAMAVIRSPSISDMEVLAAASNRAVCDDVIRYIANSREFTKDYAVKFALVNNPKCPLGSSLRLIAFLRPDDLRTLARSRNIPSALSTAARKLIQTRAQSG